MNKARQGERLLRAENPHALLTPVHHDWLCTLHHKPVASACRCCRVLALRACASSLRQTAAQACPAATCRPVPCVRYARRYAPEPPKAKTLEAVNWPDLPGWMDDDPRWRGGFSAAVPGSRRKPPGAESCALRSNFPPAASARNSSKPIFCPYRVANADGSAGLATGYYEPLLRGSRRKRGLYRYPLYAAPEDLLIVDLAEINPER